VQDALITGLHRSGTTLLCHLINKLPNAVALDEPLNVSSYRDASEEALVQGLDLFFAEQRKMILSTGLATSKSAAGKIPTNQLADVLSDGTRQSVIDGNQLHVANVNTSTFDLFIKHPAFFSVMLPCLEKHFRCYANIRNPLAILLSWNTANFNVTNGRAPAAEMMNADLRNRLDAEPDRLERQLLLLDFFFGCYAACRSTTIIRYEDVIATSGRMVSALNRQACYLNVPLSSRNRKEIHPSSDFLRIGERLLNSSNSCWLFYSHDDVCNLLSSVSG
jgi:hypothetical protein